MLCSRFWLHGTLTRRHLIWWVLIKGCIPSYCAKLAHLCMRLFALHRSIGYTAQLQRFGFTKMDRGIHPGAIAEWLIAPAISEQSNLRWCSFVICGTGYIRHTSYPGQKQASLAFEWRGALQLVIVDEVWGAWRLVSSVFPDVLLPIMESMAVAVPQNPSTLVDDLHEEGSVVMRNAETSWESTIF